MGIYLVGADADASADVASLLDAELERRGRPPYRPTPVEEAGLRFEEKLIPSLGGFEALCEKTLPAGAAATFLDWTMMLPVELGEPIVLPVASNYADVTVVVGAPEVLAAAERLASAVALPPEVPTVVGDLDLTNWFRNGPGEEVAAVRPGPWSEDLGTAFYVALHLRAAQHSLRYGCPMVYI